MTPRLAPVFFTVSAVLLLAAACGPRPPAPEAAPPEPARPPAPAELILSQTMFAALPGWNTADLRPALEAFRRSCALILARDPGAPMAARAPQWGVVSEWSPACGALPPVPSGEDAEADADAARAFFAAHFTPLRAEAADSETGLLTGYYEPELEVRAAPSEEFSAPLHAKPSDLVQVNLGVFDPDLAGRSLTGMVRDGALVPYDSRADIAADRAPVLAWARPVEAFFLQVQGSGRLAFPNGARQRAAFAAHNGRPYRSIGQVLIQRGELTADNASMQNIQAWTQRAGPEAARALFNENPRYVFFAAEAAGDPAIGPRGAQGAPLTAMGSMAVDPGFHAYGAPVWIEANLPAAPGDWRGQETALLVVAQDTGGAITGPLRGDLFFGTGDDAGARAGVTRAQARWTVLAPHAVAARLAGPRS